MFKISLQNNKEFKCESNETIFTAAQKSGITLEHSCLSGRCRSCVAKVTSGVTQNLQEDIVLTSKEITQGKVLMCITSPLTDLELAVEDLSDYNLSSPRTIPAKIDEIVKLTVDVIRVVLRLPPNSNFRFNPGQYVNIIKGSLKRSYSISNHQVKGSKLTFLIKNYQGGEMSAYWFKKAKENDLLRIEGPLGTFFYRPHQGNPMVVFLATGTGIAPIIGLLQELEQYKSTSLDRVVLLWGVRHEEDLFIDNTFFTKFKNVEYIPVVSQPKQNWTGQVGYVQNVLINLANDLSASQVYACGNNAMIHEAKQLLTEKGLSENMFYSDAFLCSK